MDSRSLQTPPPPPPPSMTLTVLPFFFFSHYSTVMFQSMDSSDWISAQPSQWPQSRSSCRVHYELWPLAISVWGSMWITLSEWFMMESGNLHPILLLWSVRLQTIYNEICIFIALTYIINIPTVTKTSNLILWQSIFDCHRTMGKKWQCNMYKASLTVTN